MGNNVSNNSNDSSDDQYVDCDSGDDKYIDCDSSDDASIDCDSSDEDTGRPQGAGISSDGEVGGKILDDSPGSGPVTVAIDFGTTFFGCAYRFRDGKKIICYNREPTSLLLNPDRTFSALGKKAIDTFYSLDPLAEQKNYFFYSQFKMRLYDTKKLSRNTKLKDENNKKLKAMKIFVISFEAFKKEILQRLNGSKAGEITTKDVLWVITIPAIWTDEARQFMSEAARKAGLTRTRLVLEPEAAALYVIRQRLEFDGQSGTIARFQVGEKYIVADLGGGTVDMCVHEILEGNKLRELYRATGDYAGGTTVNDKFLEFLKNLFGKEALTKLKKTHPYIYNMFLKSVEEWKCSFTRDTREIKMHFDSEVIKLSQEVMGKSIEQKISQSEFKETVSYTNQQYCLKVQNSEVRKFFDTSVNTIISSLKEILGKCQADNISNILLVGGYSESRYVRDEIKTAFPDMDMISVQDGRHAVVKGAVLMGEKPRDIIERRARFTYGFGFRNDFKEGKHPEKFKIYWEGKAKCKGVFTKLIEAGQILHYSQQFSKNSYHTLRLQEHKHVTCSLSLWRSPLPDPTYCYDEADQCEEVATITAQAPPAGWPDRVNFNNTLIVGETELTVKTLIKETGQELETTIDFL